MHVKKCPVLTFPKATRKFGLAAITFPAVSGIFNFMAYSIGLLRLLSFTNENDHFQVGEPPNFTWASCGACDNKVINVLVCDLCEDSIGSEQSARMFIITNRLS